MKISILGTNGFLSTAIAKYANEAGWALICTDLMNLLVTSMTISIK